MTPIVPSRNGSGCSRAMASRWSAAVLLPPPSSLRRGEGRGLPPPYRTDSNRFFPLLYFPASTATTNSRFDSIVPSLRQHHCPLDA